MNQKTHLLTLAFLISAIVIISGVYSLSHSLSPTPAANLIVKSTNIVPVGAVSASATASSTSATVSPEAAFPTASNVKAVELEGKYSIQVPSEFEVDRVKNSFYRFTSTAGGKWRTFQIALLPYSVNGDSTLTGCKVSAEFDKGDIAAPIYCDESGEGNDFVDYFPIPGNLYVRYAWSVDDNSQECTANSPCPYPVTPASRYSVYYYFVVPDKAHDTIVEFEAPDAFQQPTREVNGFEGIASALRDTIIPSLVAIQ